MQCSAFDHLMHEQIRVSKHRKYWKPVWKSFGIVVCRYPRVEQGIIGQWCQWIPREEALDIAKNTGQILRHCGRDRKELFSENLY